MHAMAGYEPEYVRPPLRGLLVAVIGCVLATLITYELWPKPIPPVLIGLGVGCWRLS